ncbi:hypothetical protein OURE66S_00099 [Oligella ureolytica]
MHIGIAGAGLTGRLLAYALSTHGHQVEVFDPAPDAALPASPPAGPQQACCVP